MSDSTHAAIDDAAFETLMEIADGDAEFLRELVGQYASDAARLAASLVAAAEAKDAEGIERAAHTLKSASANVGALHLSTLCEDLQRRGRAGELDGVDEPIRDAAAEFERAKLELEERVAKLA